MVTTTGAATVPTLDGLHLLGAAADSWEVVESELVGTIRMASGAVREQRLAPVPGSPVIRRWYGVTLDYRHLGPLAEAVEARLAFPGPHDLTLWKHVTLGYLADGHRSEWDLPWRQAPHHLTPPAGAPLDRFAPTIRLGWEGPPLQIQEPASATYAAGTPSPGEAWFEKGSRRFKLQAPPLTGTRLILQLVPLFAMVVAAEDQSRHYRDWIREPRRIALVETEI
ncbi:MAG TPA: hypothetical protein VN493_31005 [Thermoanaerobaculia bacterium]|nr:hypothetical protein [Thermoanaerobaculia bacterium]